MDPDRSIIRASRTQTVSPWSRRALEVDICQSEPCRPDTCQPEQAPEAAAPYAAGRRRRQRSAWPRMQPAQLESSACVAPLKVCTTTWSERSPLAPMAKCPNRDNHTTKRGFFNAPWFAFLIICCIKSTSLNPDANSSRTPPSRRRRAAECGQQFPPSDGDCHTPLPCEVRKG